MTYSSDEMSAKALNMSEVAVKQMIANQVFLAKQNTINLILNHCTGQDRTERILEGFQTLLCSKISRLLPAKQAGQDISEGDRFFLSNTQLVPGCVQA